MASSTTYFSILIFLTLSSSLHVHARESKFFSKVTNDNNDKEVLPTKELEEPLNKPELEPNFIPQNQQNSGGYGLYGHESGQLPPTTTTTTTTENLPYKTETENSYNKEFNPGSNNVQYYNNDAYVNPESYSNSNNGEYYNNDGYVNPESYSNPNNGQYYNNEGYRVTKPQGMSDTRFMNKVYKPYTTPINKGDNFFNGGNMYNNRLHGVGETRLGVKNGNNYNIEKQGMSDTRFLEGGRYFYDINSESKYNLNDDHVNENSRGFNSRNEYYKNRGNYGNSFRGQYGNTENSYEANNYMEGYNGNQEEFQESQDEQFVP
ncbi:hypothetical protein POM88_034806 [Heracleum sosnowskyi]|uniref:Protein E6-like n=1 Tax=Heracleum sosnowskyi TaxID=360622 RepID=A0AAD8HLV0_9APIA|nr:hypothetical protein POM88_034806 [Heracleum sosnowskyi]